MPEIQAGFPSSRPRCHSPIILTRLDRPGQKLVSEMIALYGGAIRAIRKAGKIAATATGHPALIRAAVEAGVQILICANEMGCLRMQLAESLKKASEMCGSTR
ncbi:MAG: hypothetical protein HY360_00190 [Verrucomicrobia bacterium]|nr:hypothetical protein [Verrucomicrobiota bacterium]